MSGAPAGSGPGLPAKVALGLAGAILAIAIPAIAWELQRARTQAGEVLAQRAEQRVLRLSVGLREALYGFDERTVRDLLGAEMQDPETHAVLVWAENRGRLLAGLEARDGLPQPAAGPPADRTLVRASRPVASVGADGRVVALGEVELFLSPQPAEARARADAVSRAVGAVALAVALALVFYFAVLAKLVRPLEALRGAMTDARQRLATPEGAQRLPEGSPLAGWRGAFAELKTMGDDLGSLVAAVNQSAAALRAREADLRITLDSIGDAVIATDASLRVTRMNPVASRLTGVPLAEATGRLLQEVYAPARQDPHGDPAAAALASRAAVSPAAPAALRARDGTERWISEAASPLAGPEGEALGVVVVFRDVSEQRALEERVHQAQKMDALGQLAGGIAHDFNNMLTPIVGYAQLLRDELSGELSGDAEVVLETAKRAAGLTRQLLAFARKAATVKRPVEVHQVVDDTIDLLRHSLDKRIAIETALEARRDVVLGDPSLLQNALLNLALNARDAMPDGGRLRFASRALRLSAADCQLFASFTPAPGDYLEVSVADTGQGMPPDVQARLFEPFFTTKAAGKGTGLGLAAVYGTVKEHGGAVRVLSRPGEGTVFRLYLPLQPEADAGRGAGEARPARARGFGKVLVVDDEEVIRRLVARCLGDQGFECVFAADGEEALQVFERERIGLRLVVLDVILPRLHGREVLAALIAREQDLPVVLLSGNAAETFPPAILGRKLTAFLQKPFLPAELAQEVDRLLREAPQAPSAADLARPS